MHSNRIEFIKIFLEAKQGKQTFRSACQLLQLTLILLKKIGITPHKEGIIPGNRYIKLG